MLLTYFLLLLKSCSFPGSRRLESAVAMSEGIAFTLPTSAAESISISYPEVLYMAEGPEVPMAGIGAEVLGVADASIAML